MSVYSVNMEFHGASWGESLRVLRMDHFSIGLDSERVKRKAPSTNQNAFKSRLSISISVQLVLFLAVFRGRWYRYCRKIWSSPVVICHWSQFVNPVVLTIRSFGNGRTTSSRRRVARYNLVLQELWQNTRLSWRLRCTGMSDIFGSEEIE